MSNLVIRYAPAPSNEGPIDGVWFPYDMIMKRGSISLNKRKLIHALMAVSLVLVSACSASGSTPEDKGTTPQQPASSGEAKKEFDKITVHVGINWIPPVKNDGIFDQLRAEASGVYTKWTYETSDNEDTGRRLKLTSGDLPDVWAFYGPNGPAQADFLNAKVVEPIEKYLEMPDKYPNLAKIPKAIKEYVKAPDGHTYFLPLFLDLEGVTSPAAEAAKEGFWSWGQFGVFVRMDVLEKTGMKKEDLATLDGFEKFLKEAAKQKDPQGNPLIPLTMSDNFRGWRVVGSMFGVDNVNEASGFAPDGKGGFVATRDNPKYKDAWAWLNKMYTAGLLDKETPTHKKELALQKVTTGRVAVYLGEMTDIATKGWGPAKDMNDISTKFEAIPFPKVPGVDKIGAAEAKSVLPWTGAYLMKGKNLEASLKYLDWTLGHDIITVNFGPPGDAPKHVWNWVDDKKTVWAFHKEFAEDLTGGDQNKAQKYGAQPWFLAQTNIPDKDTSKTVRDTLSYKLETKSGSLLAKAGAKRDGHNYDAVPVLQGGVMEKYKPALDTVEKEYRAKMLIAETPDKFEEVWKKYREELESKGKWTDVKAEWLKQYEEFSKKVKF